MNPRKRQFSGEVIHTVRDLCSVVFNIKSDEQLEKVFGINNAQLEMAINKVISALPDHVFEQLYPRLLEEIKNICAREFIFFQAQEKWNDPHYQEDLSNFICVFSRDILRRIDAYNNSKSKMKEE